MRPRSLLLIAVLALLAPGAGEADAGVSRRVEAEFRSGVHRIELTANLQGMSLASSPTHLGATVYAGSANIFWRRSDYVGDPWFESADGEITAEIDDANGTIRLRGSLEEFFHDRTSRIDITFRRAEGTPYADIYPPGPSNLAASARSGIRWGGTATGSVAGSLGSLGSLSGSATSTLTVAVGARAA